MVLEVLSFDMKRQVSPVGGSVVTGKACGVEGECFVLQNRHFFCAYAAEVHPLIHGTHARGFDSFVATRGARPPATVYF